MMIALDLEASLIDNAISGAPRPGLHTFIEFCIENFDRIALLTTVEEPDARDVLYSLADSGASYATVCRITKQFRRLRH